MMRTSSGQPARRVNSAQQSSRRNGHVISILSLFLLLLAFFLMLNSMTRLKADRTQQALGSLSDTFRTSVFGQGGAKTPTPLQGAERLELQISDILADQIPLREIEVARRGTELFLSIPDGEIFMPSGSALRTDRGDLLDELATAVIDAPAGLRHDLDIEIGSPTLDEADLRFPVRRLGMLARAFIARGVSGSAVAAGLVGAARHRVRLVFRVSDDVQP